MSSASQPSGMRVDQTAEIGLPIGEQPGASGQPGVARPPYRTRPAGRTADDLGDRVEVQIRVPSASSVVINGLVDPA
jgi:hypothetical protein